MLSRRFCLLLFGVALFAGPVSAVAQWDYLFEDLSWTAQGTVSSEDLSLETSLVQIETPSGYFDYLFTDLDWPDSEMPTLDISFAHPGNDGAPEPASGFFNYLFEDITWPGSASLVGVGEGT